MHANALRKILLVKSVEDEDADGAVLTLAERDAATRSALRALPPVDGHATADRDARAWNVLAARAAELYDRLGERHPVVVRTVTLEAHATQAAWALLVFAFVAGLVLSLVDSRVRIEILAFPLLGVVLWNLVVYAVLALAALRRVRPRASAAPRTAAGWIAWPLRWGWRRAAALVRQAAFYHRPLAAALRRYSDEWWPIAQPLLALQGRRLFHAAAAALAVGLVAGFYVRGLALEYRAGWESTFLSTGQVRALVHAIYAPASAVTGVGLPPDDAAVEALHWRDGAGGGPAAPWIHLMAATALLFVVLPRALLAVGTSVALARASGRLEPPEALSPYARTVLDGSDAAPAAVAVRVVPYAYRPDARSLDGLERLLRAAFGPGTRLDVDPTVAYGDEQALAGRATTVRHDLYLPMFNLASTPEAENHGHLIAAVREVAGRASPPTRWLTLVDESPFLATMRGDASLAGRVDERREAWRGFVVRHGGAACLADLASIDSDAAVPGTLAAGLRAAARGARA